MCGTLGDILPQDNPDMPRKGYLCPKTSPDTHRLTQAVRMKGLVEVARTRVEQSGAMGGDAERLRVRTERLGISDSQLARESGVNRDTIAAIKGGQGFRRSSLTKIEAALERLEQEAGMEPPPAQADLIEFEIQVPGEPSATVVVRGAGAEEAVARLLRRLRSESGGD